MDNHDSLYIKSLGEIKFKFVSVDDFIQFLSILKKDLSNREKVLRILKILIIQPKLSLQELRKITKKDLIEIIIFLIENREVFSKGYKNNGDPLIDFLIAIEVYQKYLTNLTSNLINETIKPTQEIINNFKISFRNILQQSISTTILDEKLFNITKISEQISNYPNLIVSSYIPILEQQFSFAKTLQDQLTPLINSWLSSAITANISNEFLVYWTKFSTQAKISKREVIDTLYKYKWFITPNIPESLLIKITEIAKRKGRQDKAINQLFFETLSHQDWALLDKMYQSWKENPLFKNRCKILKDCINIIKKGDKLKINYANIVLPTLIIQIDGLISDFLLANNLSWGSLYEDKTYRNSSKKGRKTLIRENSPEVMDSELDSLANDIFLDILFQSSQIGRPLKTPFNFNRHKIIHGENTRYGRKDYLIRALLIIDFISHF